MRQDYDLSIHLHPVIEPFDSGYFEQDMHKIYYEQIGNPEGKVVLFLHGGPGAGCSSAHRRLFDPEKLTWINGVHIREMDEEKLSIIVKEKVSLNTNNDKMFLNLFGTSTVKTVFKKN